jgi:GT2 family glycosyltransferase/predicted Zn-dependent protease
VLLSKGTSLLEVASERRRIMTLRYFYGPVAADFAARNLAGPRRRGECLAFDLANGADLTIGPADTWEDVCRRFPAGWQPDFLALGLHYTHIPACLWSAPVPVVGLAADWNLLFHWYRYSLMRQCELVLTDMPGVEVLARSGIHHARAANLFGLDRAFLDNPPPEGPRDLDILFCGNLHPSVQRQRLPWLGRLAALAGRYRVAIRTGVFGADYRALLARARIVFNLSIRGEANLRAFEAAAGGALLFQEGGNREVPDYFRDRQEAVFYGDDNLETLLAYYLDHEDQRRAIAEAARRRVRDYTFEALWQVAVTTIEESWPEVQERYRQRPEGMGQPALPARTWQALCSSRGRDPLLSRDLQAALVEAPHDAGLHNALGLAVALDTQGNGPATAAGAARAAEYFARALAQQPGHVVAGLNLAEALVAAGQDRAAVQAARGALDRLDRAAELPPAVLEAGHFPPGFDLFRVEWEGAAWQHAGSPSGEERAKRQLLRWRLHALLAELTGELPHYYEAALARPDLPPTRAALGCALARQGKLREAVGHLRHAVEANPFDRAAARALFQVFADLGDPEGQRRFARSRLLLHRAAPEVVPAEPWFADAAPGGDELASLIILCCNQLDCTRLCLESVLRQTRRPYELILVDNGSTDGTAAYLQEIQARPGPARVEVIRNEANVGFPAGCNQGLARARGRYLVLLNNDTVVTPGWLEGLIRWSLHDWPSVGLVGAVTNASRPPQEVAVDYRRLDDLDAFAARRRQQFAGKALEVERLTGFCLLARREVLEKVGVFDEQFGVGFFDDDDLSVRARQAGFRLLVAQDVFVHHFGSRTFTGLGIDCPRQLRDNFERFRAKWGERESAGYRPPPAPAAGPTGEPPVATGRPRVSLCLIVKNEAENLPACLESAAGLADEVIVVDTGSTDRTKEVAARLGARVFDFAWVDSFSAARNECLRHAAGEWIFWLDADDRIDDENRQKLRALFAGLGSDNAAYVMKCLCLPDPVSQTATEVDHVRLFRNHPQIRWEHRVHEQILPGVRRSGGEVRWSDVVIHHTGYQDPALRRRKLDRDLRLLKLEEAEQPDHPFTLFNLGSVYQELGQTTEAIALFRRSLARSQAEDSIVHKLYALLAQCHRQLGRPQEALVACQEGRGHSPDDVELLFQEALARRDVGDRNGAEACWLRLLQGRPPRQFGSVDVGVRGYKARHNLALLYREQGRLAEAEMHWQAALAERPDFAPALVGLGEVYLAQERWIDLEKFAAHLRETGLVVDGEVLEARALLARQQYQAARLLLEEVIGRHPEALYPWVILSHVLLQEGKDRGSAEYALRQVLARDPQHAQAWHNLHVLLHQPAWTTRAS